MLLAGILLIPAFAAGIAYILPRRATRFAILLITSVIHFVLTSLLWVKPDAAAFGGWLRVDALALVVLTVISVVFLATSIYAVGLLGGEDPRGGRLFVSCLLAFLSTSSLVASSQHFALLWVGMESTTLAVAPLIFHRHDRRSLEAVWKYLVISSVGIAFALLAVFLLSTSQPVLPGTRALVLDDVLAGAGRLDKSWLRAAYVFALAGFGTKMGLAPLHFWKPDTYGEAPSLVGALMAGVLTSCAFLGLARFTEVAVAAGLADFVQPLLIAFGLVSLAIAAAFMIAQADVKRLLAYSSIEHMGLLVLGIGVGGVGAYGSMLHVLNNGVAKGMLFLVVGNLVLATGSSAAADLGPMFRLRPWSAMLLLFGLFAVTGSPPFGLFVSEFSIVSGAIRQQHWLVAGVLLALLSVIFVGIGGMFLRIVFGGRTTVPLENTQYGSESAWMLAGPLALAALVVTLGLYIPRALQASLADAARLLGGTTP